MKLARYIAVPDTHSYSPVTSYAIVATITGEVVQTIRNGKVISDTWNDQKTYIGHYTTNDHSLVQNIVRGMLAGGYKPRPVIPTLKPKWSLEIIEITDKSVFNELTMMRVPPIDDGWFAGITFHNDRIQLDEFIADTVSGINSGEFDKSDARKRADFYSDMIQNGVPYTTEEWNALNELKAMIVAL